MGRVVVTGGVGFIGYHVSRARLARGDDVLVLDDFSDAPYPEAQKRENARDLASAFGEKVTIHEGTVTSRATVDAALEGAEAIVHLAGLAPRHVDSSIAVPGHDMDALAFYNSERRLLISGDALWRNGFGVVFSELLGHPEDAGGLKAAHETLDRLARLPVDLVIPGHGAPFVEVDDAFERAYRKLAAFEQDVELLARHALKVILVFALLERRQLARAELPEFLAGLSFCQSVNARYLQHSNDFLAHWLVRDLIRGGALKDQGGVLIPV